MFKRKAEELLMLRYTWSAWQELYPEFNKDVWEAVCCPNNIAQFIKTEVVRYSKRTNDSVSRALIVTLDDDYVKWLKNKKKCHNEKIAMKYVKENRKNVEFWNQKLVESNMTQSYNVLGLQILMLLSESDKRGTHYYLQRDAIESIESILGAFYNTKYIYAPGWILKGCDAPACYQDIIFAADVFWDVQNRIRLGKYLEQNYSVEEVSASPSSYCMIPFVIKTEITMAEINLSGTYDKSDQSPHAMTFLQFTPSVRSKLFSELSNAIPQIISVGTNAVMPGQAYVAYKNSMAKTINKKSNVFSY